MKGFAYIVSPITMQQVKRHWPLARFLPVFLANSILNKISPFKVTKLRNIQSSQKKLASGFIVMCPFLGDGPKEEEAEYIMDKILSAAEFAKRRGAKIIGLNSSIPAIAGREQIISRRLKIPITTGASYTAWGIIEAIYRMAKIKKIDLKKSAAAVLGATTAVGSLCARKLSEYCAKIILFSAQKEKLERLKESFRHIHSVEVAAEENALKAAQKAEIIINTDMNGCPNLDTGRLKHNAIICDLSLERPAINKNLRPHLSYIYGGLVKMPFAEGQKLNIGFSRGIIPASLAEVMLLSLERKFVNYSLGENINPDKVEEIADLGVRHGFEVWVPEAPVL